MVLVLLMLSCFGETINLTQWDIFEAGSYDVNDHGTICLADRSNTRLVWINDTGKLLQTAGNPGYGPGEFRSIAQIIWHREERLFWVYDWRQDISKWRDGTLIKEYKVQPILRSFIPVSAYEVAFASDVFGQKGSQPSLQSLQFESGLKRVLWERDPLEESHGFHRAKDPVFSFKLPWNPRLLIAQGRDIFALCYNDRSQVHIFGRVDQKLLRTIDVSFPRLPLTEETFRGALKQSLSPRTWKRISAFVPYPKNTHWPMVLGLKIDGGDRIWVFGKGEAHSPYKVIGMEGRVEAQGVVEASPYDIHIRNGKVY